MDELEVFCQFSILEQALVVSLSLCIPVLVTVLVFAPKRDCFFFRWSPEARFIALLFAPALLLLWPIVVYGWVLQSRGVDPSDPDFLDD